MGRSGRPGVASSKERYGLRREQAYGDVSRPRAETPGSTFPQRLRGERGRKTDSRTKEAHPIHLHAETGQPGPELRLQGQEERGGAGRGAAAGVRQDHLNGHLGQVAAQVYRALHVLVDQQWCVGKSAAWRRGPGPEQQE